MLLVQIVHASNQVSVQLDVCVSALRTTKEFLLNVSLLLELRSKKYIQMALTT